MTGHDEKASRYAASLDVARVSGSWGELPELIRKIKKHAPQRKLLVHTASAESYVATHQSTKSATSDSNVTLLEELSSEIAAANGDRDEEEILQAKVCLLWSVWLVAADQTLETAAALGFSESLQNVRLQNISTWTRICLIKGAYIEGTAQKKAKRISLAMKLFMQASVAIHADHNLVFATPQLSYWSEQVFAQLALISVDDNSVSSEATAATTLEVFRHWLTIVSRTSEVPATKYGNSSAHIPRMQMWRHYYQHLSLLLKLDSEKQIVATAEHRQETALELRRVETLYENELLQARKFPTATESNTEIEDWIEQVVANWQILCGSGWRDNELGEGGRHALSRGVLDILYRAATKTFHSTLILRRLFQVHKSLTEFDLAYRSLDTYIELVERAKERAAKSTIPVHGIETTQSFLLTMSEGVEGLCTFGRQKEAQKAYDLCLKLEEWLDKTLTDDQPGLHSNGEALRSGTEPGSVTFLSREALETTYRALGVGIANWARWTPFSERRTQLQEGAVKYLGKACAQRPSDELHVQTHYATALVLAETREISEAIKHTKSALEQTTRAYDDADHWTATRKSVPLWHLLALLLSSRHEFDSAFKSCTTAFEQFPSSTALVGTDLKPSSVIGEKSQGPSKVGLVHDMECDELQAIIETRITELALTELRDGPEEAVNGCNELLRGFSQLFSHLDLDTQHSKLAPPSTTAGTIKSTKGSIFGRRKNHVSAVTSSHKGGDTTSLAQSTPRPSTQATQAPTIQVTDEHGKSPHSRRHKIRDSLEKRQDGKAAVDTSKKLVRKSSQRSARTAADPTVSADVPVNSHHGESPSAGQSLPQVEHNLALHDLPPPASHDEQPPQQDTRLPNVHAFTSATSLTPRFPRPVLEKHALAILTKVWLVIATLYRRASMFEDSKEACEEAEKAVSRIEGMAGSVDRSAHAFAHPGWGGGGKSVDELWADVYCERAELQLAIHQRRVLDRQEANNQDLRVAVEHYEQCLMLSPDHPSGIVGLSNLLLDFFERKIELSKVAKDVTLLSTEIELATINGTAEPAAGNQGTYSETQSVVDAAPGAFEVTLPPASISQPNGTPRGALTSARPSISASDDPRLPKTDQSLRKTPENLDRIAARDRAYGLLSGLTKLGSGWDNSEAWYALARAHELSGEIDKAKSSLWWCIDLEDSRPIRHWRNLRYSLD